MTTDLKKPFWQRLRAAGRNVGLIVAVAVGLVVGALLHAAFSPTDRGAPTDANVSAKTDAPKSTTRWTCSMHPQIKLPKPGLCPICNMPLIPLKMQDSDSGSLRQLTVSENARRLMDIETSPVERKFVPVEIGMVGKIDYDETRLKYITAWIPGRLDKVHVDYTGVMVKKGHHMVELYSPELLGAQEELLQAIEAVKGLADSDIGIVRETTEATLAAAREKLRLWGLKPEQIAEIEKTGKVSDHITIYAPSGGIVIHKNAQQGMYVRTGTRIYTIADLTWVWVRLDAYESDLTWLRYGQKVEFTTEAYPGRTFIGTITFIDPILTQTSRTVKVRVNVPNPKMLLKPGMFVRAVVKSRFATAGKVIDPALAGKWICPMHHEVVKDAAGECDICRMDLVPAESIGFVGREPEEADAPLVIPTSAALLTGGRKAGSRAVVYLEIDPSLLHVTSVTSWPAMPVVIRKGLAAGKQTPLARLWGLLDAGLQKDLLAVTEGETPPADVQNRFIAELNRFVRGTELYDANTWRDVSLGDEANRLIKDGIGKLPPRKRHRLNRLMIEAIFPDQIARSRFAPTFVGREIVLGPKAGKYFLVRHGLAEGERVVTKGAFKIDAELQIMAKPSMMTPEGAGAGGGGHQHGSGAKKGAKDDPKATGAKLPAVFVHQLRAVLAAGKDVGRAVASESLEKIKQAFAALDKRVEAVAPEKLDGPDRLLWVELSMFLTNDAVDGQHVENTAQAKRALAEMEAHLASMKSRFALAADSAKAAGTGDKGAAND